MKEVHNAHDRGSDDGADNGCADGVQQPFELPIGRQQMADILGLTIETVSRQLTRMRGNGVIDLSGRRGMVINDRGALEAMAEAA